MDSASAPAELPLALSAMRHATLAASQVMFPAKRRAGPGPRRTPLETPDPVRTLYRRRRGSRAAVKLIAAAQLETLATLANLMTIPRTPRRWWVYPNESDWWERFSLHEEDDRQWVHYFRLPRDTFQKVVAALAPEVAKGDTQMRRAIPVQKRVAIGLWMLANQCSYRKTAQHFGVGRATVGNIFLTVVLAMEMILLPRIVRLGDALEIMDGFAELGFPQVVGAVDGCHCAIVSPVRQGGHFSNRKKTYSVLLQGVTDHTGRFINIEIGQSGSNLDVKVIQNSAVFEKMEAGVFVPGNPTITVGGTRIGPLLVSDGGYPIRRWMMTPYSGELTKKQVLFNRRLSHAKAVVEMAFVQLKGRWQCLTAPLEVSEENVPSVIAACVILHNICETNGRALDDFTEVPQPVLPSQREPMEANAEQKKTEGEAVRGALADCFWAEGM
ncbi:uncharacterized protein LOC103278531 [Anolis carolinensis]|uniref:DDE Tnp4 domain-containing protein n=1 Tax=Anolis carolinensis TaxID=28377 RepID=A0A803TAG2_ANOCA|nr:PREDICTED: putative nuclease HARBI1 [Anolis carolinensis]|eukprot:XP_008106845.1 PREDICTED: putative nuclease HARBI1 [Anolis carolinensis]